ncbi:hypothetical protein NDU88_005821 [Pleurodeles waltl]|uniref:Uncharacterized protein n=1 Tax=Pleurodeles waltl TaxID=8319 RepID=A0AAV7PJL3_PLEWA|nr:hypothetical protein NDU88_005821 [Pleurodeles waltl]
MTAPTGMQLRGSSAAWEPQPEVRACVSAAGFGTAMDQAERQQDGGVRDRAVPGTSADCGLSRGNEGELDFDEETHEEREFADEQEF